MELLQLLGFSACQFTSHKVISVVEGSGHDVRSLAFLEKVDDHLVKSRAVHVFMMMGGSRGRIFLFLRFLDSVGRREVSVATKAFKPCTRAMVCDYVVYLIIGFVTVDTDPLGLGHFLFAGLHAPLPLSSLRFRRRIRGSGGLLISS